MAKLYSVRLKEDYRWKTANVAGRPFNKHEAVELNEHAINAEILNSPILDVEIVAPEATDSARELAEEQGVDLSDVTGRGEEGRILVGDVRTYLEERAHDPQDTD